MSGERSEDRAGVPIPAGSEFRCAVCGVPTPHCEVYEKDGYPILACSRCGLGSAHIDPGFDLAKIYNDAYFSGGQTDGYADYLGSEPVLRREFRRVLAELRKCGSMGGKLLELGCAYGFFLSEACDYYECLGVEVAPSAVAFARSRGLEVVEGSLREGILAERGPFDVVAMLDCIEHLHAPDETVAMLARGLRPGGHIVITTGNWGSAFARLTKTHWRLMTPPQHLFYFSKRTLAALLKRNGFEVLSVTVPWKLVPIGLALYQVASRAGLKVRVPAWLGRVAVPVNLFDTVRVVARKK
jgi:SAM-dependent methyltransferase